MKRNRILEAVGYRFVANDSSRMIHSVKHSNKRCSIYEQKNARYVNRKEADLLVKDGYVACICTKADGLYKYISSIKRTLAASDKEKPRTGGGTHP